MTRTGKHADGGAAARKALDALTLLLIDSVATAVRKSIERGELPHIELPVRSLANVSYDAEKGYFELGEALKTRTLTVNTVRSFAQTLRLMAASRQMVQSDDFATKREAYYIRNNFV